MKSAWVITQASVARMERSEIRGGIDASRLSRITLRSIRATLPARRTRAIYDGHFSPHSSKDLFAAPKILPFNDFLHFGRCALVRDLTAGPRCGSASFNAPRIRARENPHEYAIFAGP